MFDYLQQFNNLPKDLRDKVSSPEAMEALAALEKKYQVELAVLVMKVMVKSLPLKSLPINLVEEFGLETNKANKLAEEMTETIFIRAADHLQLQVPKPKTSTVDSLDFIVKEAGVILPSSDLLSRFKIILSTYLKGVRSKIATRDALAKDISLGGLNLGNSEIDRVFKVCDNHSSSNLEKKISLPSSSGALDKIIAAESIKGAHEEYDFKKALASGQIKRPTPKLESPEKPVEISLPEEKKSLEAPEEIKRLESPDKLVLPEIVPVNKVLKKETEIRPGSQTNTPVNTVVAQQPKVQNDEHHHSVPKSENQSDKKNDQISNSQPRAAVSQAAPVSASHETKKPDAGRRFSLIPSWLRRSSREKTSEKKAEAPAQVKPIVANSPSVIKEVKEVKEVIEIKEKKIIEKETGRVTTPLKDNEVRAQSEQVINRPPAVASARPANHLKETTTKPVMHDVKPAPRLMGPIEELQFLDLVNFRRLGKNPEEISAKIFSKIKLLEADGYDKMIAGVRAWRRSPVNLLYLKMMKEAISKGQTIKDFAASVQKDKDSYLSLEEIEGIIAMNSKLIF